MVAASLGAGNGGSKGGTKARTQGRGERAPTEDGGRTEDVKGENAVSCAFTDVTWGK